MAIYKIDVGRIIRLSRVGWGFADGLREEIHLDIEVRNTLQVKNALAKSDYKVRILKYLRLTVMKMLL